MTELKTDVAIAKIGKATISIKDLESNYTHVITREIDDETKTEVYSLESFYKGEKKTEPIIEEPPIDKKETPEEKQARLDKAWLG